MADELAPTLQEAEQREGPERLALMVIGGEGISSHVLPESGTVTIGRSSENTIRLDDGLISRTHVAIHIGLELQVEDLESANGTRIAGRTLSPYMKESLQLGQVVDLGSSMVIVQRARSLPLPIHRLVSHAHLEVRLESECARAPARSPFSLIRLYVSGLSRRALENVLFQFLRAQDLVASYGPNDLELLLVDSARSRSERITRELTIAIEEENGSALVALATFPEDGLTAEALIESANAALRGKTVSEGPAVIIEDPAMRDLYRVIDRVGKGTISVLLLGETGAGKEVVASALHHASPRRDAAFVRLNCAALSETLVESQLFGYEKGSFTGADRAKPGLLEAADGGTIFLDEVGELSDATQAKLLRALEQREVLRVGATTPQAIDVRFVSATNRDLEAEVARGKFRRDLYYRLAGVTLHVPPLRDRPSEIEPLARAFVNRVSREMSRPPPSLAAAALALLRGYSWPGNIRELRNVLERAVLLAPGEVIEPHHLPVDKLRTTWPSDQEEEPLELSDEDRASRARITDALERCAGNQTRAAELLGVSRQTLSKWIGRYRIPRPRK